MNPATPDRFSPY